MLLGGLPGGLPGGLHIPKLKGFGNSHCENLRGNQSVTFVCNNVTRRLCWFTRIRTIKEFRSNWIETLYYCQLIWPQWRNWLQRRCQQERLMGNRPFAACHSPDTKSPCWDAKRRTGTNKNYVCLWLVLPQCDFCVPAWRFCTTWMASRKGPITEFYVKQQLCTCSTFFCTFLCRHCTTTTWNYQA